MQFLVMQHKQEIVFQVTGCFSLAQALPIPLGILEILDEDCTTGVGTGGVTGACEGVGTGFYGTGGELQLAKDLPRDLTHELAQKFVKMQNKLKGIPTWRSKK
ncbi:Hypothetical predicted protein [Olea europaea subsp. europaea]|uniref:Uncharacterized protein n=1 Tax=Olea europaea subsp. europaea TaxID=158383 RepID=A0A8S0QZ48_OLEEU|nr:Hypothetical predicted protein [Olea europaea subsp. europaea]